MNYLSNKEGHLRAFTFFKEEHAKKPFFPVGAEIKPLESELYVNKQITIGGKVPLLVGATDNELGITNFDGNKLEEGRAFAVDGVAFHVAIDDAGKSLGNVDFAKGLTSAEKAPFQYANLVLRQKNELLVKLPISSIWNGKSSIDNDYRDLSLTLIKPKDKVEVEIEFPDGVQNPATLTAGKEFYVSAVYRGYESYSKR